MSGIVGLISSGTAPVDRSLLESMTRFLVYRGPDRSGVWCTDDVGFGHTLLATIFEAERERQPCSLDGKTFLVADCRIDGQEDLRRDLEARGRQNLTQATDPELILHAYHTWGDQCLDHLIGDFAFAIWDASRRRLLCARDQSGVKLFYFTTKPGGLVFSNTLHCVRLHPRVSNRFDDLAVLDFLTVGQNQEPDSTTFADIKCLPPAHTLVWESGQTTIRRYWNRPIDEPICFRRSHDYVERFVELLDTSIRDRLRSPSATVQMSGGLDSTLIAARIKQITSPPFRLEAHSVFYRDLIPDQEPPYTQLAATHLGIPLHFVCGDEYAPYQGFAALAARMPEPSNWPQHQMRRDFLTRMASAGRVSFYGEGPDNLLAYEWQPYLSYLRANRSLVPTIRAIFDSLRFDPRIRYSFSARRPAADPFYGPPVFPDWLHPTMVSQYKLRDRWESHWADWTSSHPYHPNAFGAMSRADWVRIFVDADPGVTGIPMETRHPFLDLRVARFLLALPVIPWCRRKLIVRLASRQVLPEGIWRREKTPLRRDILAAQCEKYRFQNFPLPPIGDWSSYVTSWPPLNTGSSWGLMLSSAPIGLQFWKQAMGFNDSTSPGKIAGEK